MSGKWTPEISGQLQELQKREVERIKELEEEAEAAWVALRKIKNEQLSCRHDYAGMANGHYYDHCGTCAKCGIDSTDDINGDEFSLFESGFIAGARSRDALLASQGERIKELERELNQAVYDLDKARIHRTGAENERDSLRAAMEQVKAERDELMGIIRGLYDLYNRTGYVPKDHACRECCAENCFSPVSVVHGFKCSYHAARALLAAGDCTNRLNQGEKEPEVKAGASWEAQRSAVLLEALEKIGTPANQNPSESRDVLLFCEELARAALEKYRGKQ